MMLRLSLSAIAFLLASCSPPQDQQLGSSGSSRNNGASRPSATPTASIRDTVVKEGDDNTVKATVNILVRPPVTKDASIDWRTSAVNATEGIDYIASSGTILIPEGQAQATIEVPLIGDRQDEPAETFEIVLSNSKNLKIGDSKGVVTIQDNDPEPTVSFENSRVVLSENSGDATIRVRLSEPSSLDISVPISIGGSADRGLDYKLSLPNGILAIPAGQSRAEIPLSIIHDQIPEGGETIKLSMGTPTFATLPKKGPGREMSVIIRGQISLPDTGVTHYSNGVSNTLKTPPAGYPGQDADYGLDTRSATSSDGRVGFSLVKLDMAGNPLPPTAKVWYCVRDMNTGLTWEVKQPPYIPALDTSLAVGALPDLATSPFYEWFKEVPDAVKAQKLSAKETAKAIHDTYEMASLHWHAGNYSYTWYNQDRKTNGGSEGAPAPINTKKFFFGETSIMRSAADAPNRRWKPAENTDVLAKELSLFAYCGMKNWRLPTISELKSISDYDPVAIKQRGSVIPPEFFPYGAQGLYYSSTPSSDGAGDALCLDSRTGTVLFCNKQILGLHYARMVRNEEPEK